MRMLDIYGDYYPMDLITRIRNYGPQAEEYDEQGNAIPNYKIGITWNGVEDLKYMSRKDFAHIFGTEMGDEWPECEIEDEASID
jgi:hypothetical protein